MPDAFHASSVVYPPDVAYPPSCCLPRGTADREDSPATQALYALDERTLGHVPLLFTIIAQAMQDGESEIY